MTGTSGRFWKGGRRMKVIAGFRGKNREFRAWLAAGMPENVVFLAEHRKTAPGRAEKLNLSGPV
jgi:hypothetical protein